MSDDDVYCGHCGEGPFAGEHGLKTHTRQMHPDVDTVGQCCVAGVKYLPSGRPYCGECGRVLEGTDDPRVSDGGLEA